MLSFSEFCDHLPLKLTAVQKALIEQGHMDELSMACRWDGTDPRKIFMVSSNDDEIRLKRLAEDFNDDQARKRLRELEKRRETTPVLRTHWSRWGQHIILDQESGITISYTTDSGSEVGIYNAEDGTYQIIASSGVRIPTYDPDEENRLRAQSRDPRVFKARTLDWLHNRRSKKRRSRYPDFC